MSKKNVVIVGLIAIAIIGFGTILGSKDSNDNSTSTQQKTSTAAPAEKVATKTGVQKGQLAPDFSLTTIEGKTVKLSQFRGDPVIVSFVQTVGCAPCAIEAQNIRKAQDSANLKVIQVGIAPERPEDLLYFRQAVGRPEWLMGLDRNLGIAKQYNVRNIDATVMVDKEGKIIYRDEGQPAETDAILAALKEAV